MGLGASCTHGLKFKIVDADTKEPLANVAGVADGDVFDYILGSSKDTTQGRSNQTPGELQFADLRDRLSYEIVFTKAGYQPAAAEYHYASSNTLKWISPKRKWGHPPGVDGTVENASDTLIVIPLHKVPATQKE